MIKIERIVVDKIKMPEQEDPQVGQTWTKGGLVVKTKARKMWGWIVDIVSKSDHYENGSFLGDEWFKKARRIG